MDKEEYNKIDFTEDGQFVKYETAQELLTQAIAYLSSIRKKSGESTDIDVEINALVASKNSLDPRNIEDVERTITKIHKRFVEWQSVARK